MALKGNENYSEWTYDANREKIQRLLLLFNVESVRQNGENSQWFPFDKFKFGAGGKTSWSLEHINAVNSPKIKGVQADWREWLRLHINAVQSVDESLTAEVKKLLALDKIRHTDFEELQKKVLAKLSPESGKDDDYITNLALLQVGDNAALSNSVFEVKRDKIIELDMHGAFIPFCTKMAFLKYYTQSAKNQIHYWSDADKKNYIASINKVLQNYLASPINFETRRG